MILCLINIKKNIRNFFSWGDIVIIYLNYYDVAIITLNVSNKIREI